MEPLIRGLFERFVDSLLIETELKKLIELVVYFKPTIKSEEDAAFGFLIGYAWGQLNLICRTMNKREPTEEEIGGSFEILIRRSEDIKSKIRVALNL